MSRGFLICCCAALAAVATALAADPAAEDQAALGLRYGEVQQTDFEQLKRYTWHADTRLASGGETKVHYKLACRLNEKNEMTQEVVESESSVHRKRGLRGRAQAAHAEEVGAFLEKVVQVTASYIFMSKGREVDFFDKATITDGTGEDVGKMVVQSSNVSVEGDKVTKWIDPEALHPIRITFETIVDEVPVTGEVLYRPIEGGPNVPRMATINIPSEKGVIEAEFVDYEKQL